MGSIFERKEISGYDIIGDVHGHASMLKELLTMLGYRSANGTWHHGDGRKAIFVGDLIDRGPEQLETVKIVRGMVKQYDALCIMGNHEYNAIQYHLGLRKLKDNDPHWTFLAQVPTESDAYTECVDWFMTLPLWLNMGSFGIVHACWDTPNMKILETTLRLGKDRRLSEDMHRLAAKGKPKDAPDRRAYEALENILKGPEVSLPEGESFNDKDGAVRHKIRTRWYRDDASTYRELAFMPTPELPGITDRRLTERPRSLVPDKPVFIGHYWLYMADPREPLSDKVVCVDYSAGIDGPLVAYKWNKGDVALEKSRFVCVQGGQSS